ncbi:MAG: hypothetical protein D4R67_03765 [Bacteroidetes bacterium]|nr:MAG: hypothetical protein D4R67_03765 [Bacteroidota bacterium]
MNLQKPKFNNSLSVISILNLSVLVFFLLILIGYFYLETIHEETKFTPPSLTPNDWMAMQRIYPYDRINPQAYQDALNQAQLLMDNETTRATPWVMTGPTNIGGRITDIEVPDGNLQTIYVGASTGGILKTTNGGLSWTNLFQNVPVISIGDIAIDPNNSDILYAGTGEANSSSFSFWGNGIYKSYDAGLTWQHLGLDQSAYIGRVLVDYSNSQRVFVAACGYLFSYNDERGVYRSNDGGTTWERVLFLTDSTAAIDLVQHPTDPDILYATMWERTRGLEYRNSFGTTSGIWKGMDGGDTWPELTSGLPPGNNVGRIGLTISKSNPNILYAFYDLADFEVGVFKTLDGGASWTRTNDGDLWGMNSNFGWYFGQIRVDPVEPDRVFVMGVPLFKSENGGISWSDQTGNNIHVDHHAMVMDEATGTIVEGNDGGLYRSQNYGLSWSKINNLPITQFYAIDVDYLLPDRIYGGTQDNNTIRTLTGAVDNWGAILGGDGMYTLVDYTNSNVIYAESQWGYLYRSDIGGNNMQYIGAAWEGDRKNWSAPLAMHPEDPAVLYFGTYRIWKSYNKGNAWTPVSGDLTKGINQYFHSITTITISSIDPSIVLVGTGDGKVHVSADDGSSWTDISAGLPDRWVTRVAPDPFDAQTIYASLSGFRWDEPLPHVYKSTDLGQTWTSISGNLPEFPVNDLVLDPDVPDKLIAATDAGLYGTIDGGTTWQWVWTDLPAVPTYALKIHAPTRKLVAGTYGLSTYSANLDDLLTGTETLPPTQKVNLIVAPNPVTENSSVSFYLQDTDEIIFSVVTMSGQSLANGQSIQYNFEHGRHSVPLGSLFTAGWPVPGIYLVIMEGSKTKGSAKVIVTD